MPMLPKQPKPDRPEAIRQAWAAERRAARQARADRDPSRERHHLERAHILSQPFALEHVRTHLAMLGYGVRTRDVREIIGQLVRLVVAGPGSAMRRYPLGNTGGANLSAFEPMDIPDDLRAILTNSAKSP